jgi:hypothetical protein
MAQKYLAYSDFRQLLAIASDLQVDRRGVVPKLESLLAGVGELIGATVVQAYEVTYLSRTRQRGRIVTEMSTRDRGGLQRSSLVATAAAPYELHVLDRSERVVTGWGAPTWLESTPHVTQKQVICSTQFIGNSMTALAIVFIRDRQPVLGARELLIVDTAWRSFRVENAVVAVRSRPRLAGTHD